MLSVASALSLEYCKEREALPSTLCTMRVLSGTIAETKSRLVPARADGQFSRHADKAGKMCRGRILRTCCYAATNTVVVVFLLIYRGV
jgi:hypothetical protein